MIIERSGWDFTRPTARLVLSVLSNDHYYKFGLLVNLLTGLYICLLAGLLTGLSMAY